MSNRGRLLLVRSIAVIVLLSGARGPDARADAGALVARDLGIFRSVDTQGQAISDRGQIVGTAFAGPGGVLAAFLWDAGDMVDLGAFFAEGINDRGQVLLNQLVVHINDPSRCFLRDGNDLIDLGSPAGSQCSSADLNDRGQVVGTIQTFQPSFPFTSSTHAFLWDSGTFVDLGSLGGNWSMATAINDRGQIVGSSRTASGDEHAFLWDAGSMIDIGVPGGTSAAVAINNRGQALVSDGAHLLLWDHGSLANLTPDVPAGPGGLAYVPLDINDGGRILAAVLDFETGEFRCGLWEEGLLVALPSLGSGQPFGVRLNNLGQVVGTDRTSADGIAHAVLWTPRDARDRDDR
jgi:probable HAF family extracellular repeat protein